MNSLQTAKKILSEPGVTFVIVKGDQILRSSEHGIRPLLRILRDDPESLRGAIIADKIIGKAAALLMIYGKVKNVYAEIVSDPAISVFEEYAVPYEYGLKEKYIQNKDRSGMCPMESKVLNCSVPEEAYTIFSEMIPL